ncbi:MAG TPA: membrane protein insertase YidC [Acidimicrobiales bacterium]|nr:membrane protein insertase YidC [Acidimicrobiales bacterium]
MFDFIFSGLAGLLSFFYSVVPNYGIAIGLLTLTVMLLLFPLNAKGMRSMAAMSKLSPELRRIQAKNKNDRVKQNEEVMALFKEHGVTPFGGCLPFLFQAPVLFVMYNVIRGLTHIPKGSETFQPKYLDHGSKLFRDLTGSDEMVSFGLDLAKSASQVLKVSFVTAIPFLILIVGVVATGYYQQWMISRRNSSQSIEDNPMAKQMQTMTKVLPLMYLVFGFTLPAGLNVYFLVSSVFRIGQQALIYKMDPSLLPAPGHQPVKGRGKDDDDEGHQGGEAKPSPKATPAKGSRSEPKASAKPTSKASTKPGNAAKPSGRVPKAEVPSNTRSKPARTGSNGSTNGAGSPKPPPAPTARTANRSKKKKRR